MAGVAWSMIGWTAVHLAEVGEAVAIGTKRPAGDAGIAAGAAEILARSLVHTLDGRIRLHLHDAARYQAPALPLIHSLAASDSRPQLMA
jgi:hypothetical protein